MAHPGYAKLAGNSSNGFINCLQRSSFFSAAVGNIEMSSDFIDFRLVVKSFTMRPDCGLADANELARVTTEHYSRFSARVTTGGFP